MPDVVSPVYNFRIWEVGIGILHVQSCSGLYWEFEDNMGKMRTYLKKKNPPVLQKGKIQDTKS